MDTASSAATKSSGNSTQQPVPEVGIAVGEEYRRDERYPVNGDAEVVVLGGTSLFRGRIMDISVSGCYIQTLAWVRLKPETPVEILFAVDGKVIRALGASRYVKSKVGIGFRFLKMNEEMQRKLDELIDDARTRFMELTRHTKGRQVTAGPSIAAGPVPAGPISIHAVAMREQERTDSTPRATQPSHASPPPAAAVDQSSACFSPIVEGAAVAVAWLEEEAAGVQASQMLEVSESSKLQEQPTSLLDCFSPADDGKTSSEADSLAQATMAEGVHSCDVDEDVSDVGHAEIWSADTSR